MANQIGIFGKIPAHGDFVDRNLPRSFINVWDKWLQSCVQISQEQLASGWLDIYLTSPIWRFILSSGVLDKTAWAGILVPSVDSVGRYFPLSIVQALGEKQNPFAFQVQNNAWYQHLEQSANTCLQESFEVDALVRTLSNSAGHLQSCPAEKAETLVNQSYYIASADKNISSVYPGLLNSVLGEQFASRSLWWCQGSERMKPSLYWSSGLPEPRVYTAFIKGNWQTEAGKI